MTKPSRSSSRLRKSPPRSSRPTTSSLTVVKELQSTGQKRKAATAELDQSRSNEVRRTSKRLREQQTPERAVPNNDTTTKEPIVTIQSAGGRTIPMRSARSRPSPWMQHDSYTPNKKPNTKSKKSSTTATKLKEPTIASELDALHVLLSLVQAYPD